MFVCSIISLYYSRYLDSEGIIYMECAINLTCSSVLIIEKIPLEYLQVKYFEGTMMVVYK